MPAAPSLLDSLLSLPDSARAAALESLSQTEAAALLWDWPGFWARPEQLPPPGAWRTWLVLAGRGFGKTRTGAEWVRAQVERGTCGRLALVGATAADARDVMVEGESGLLAVCPPWNRPLYEPSKRRLTWPSGALATLYSADEPDRLRGPQHDGAWCDELAAWRFPDAWPNLQLGLRIGPDPRAVVTTTPKPVALVRALLADPETVVTRGSTYANARNLAPAFLRQIVRRYEGTRLGRQELLAELLEDVPGALWSRERIEALRVTQAPDLVRIVVGVDPEASSGEDAAETGIVTAGLGVDGHGYVLGDASVRGTPHVWATAAVAAYHRGRADRVVAEANQGGEMVAATLWTVAPNLPLRLVHASRNKQARAEPVAALSEQGRLHHVGAFPELEDQLCSWVPGGRSPDRLDALVWAVTDLCFEPEELTERVVEDWRVEISPL